jgi:hypothetical protein
MHTKFIDTLILAYQIKAKVLRLDKIGEEKKMSRYCITFRTAVDDPRSRYDLKLYTIGCLIELQIKSARYYRHVATQNPK